MQYVAYDGQPGTTYLHRLDGRVKTSVLLSAIVIVSALTRLPLVAGAFLVALALMFTLHLPLKSMLLRMSAPFGVAWLVLMSLIFTSGHTVIGVINFRHISLPVYREGLTLGFLIMLRILAAVSLAMLLSFSTPMVEILATLRLLKVPGVILDLADMIYRYAFSLGEIAATMRKAQRARGGEGLPRHRQARDIGMVAGNLMIKAFDRSVRIYKAMLARGYDEDAKTPPYYTGPIPAKDLLAGVLAGLVLLALLVCNFAVAWKGRS
ncbi:MAG: cobalt ECF transporter T component CbiQ [Nitrospiraceae bacterium]|nr:cobalt ECF transporter T component CbiQ [Nitrospiraceae bacterium]